MSELDKQPAGAACPSRRRHGPRACGAGARGARSASGYHRRDAKPNWYSSSCSSEYSLSPAPARSVMPGGRRAGRRVSGAGSSVPSSQCFLHSCAPCAAQHPMSKRLCGYPTSHATNSACAGATTYCHMQRPCTPWLLGNKSQHARPPDAAPPKSTARCRCAARPKLMRGLGTMPAFFTRSHCGVVRGPPSARRARATVQAGRGLHWARVAMHTPGHMLACMLSAQRC